MLQEIFVVEDELELTDVLQDKFKKDKDIRLKHVLSTDLEKCLLDIPSFILINEDKLNSLDVSKLCEIIRNSEDNSATPVVAVCSNLSFERERVLLNDGVHSFVNRPFDSDNLYFMIKNIVSLLLINRGISPLTKLPREYSYSS